ncbi:Holliday junction resolvase RuvX [Rhodobacteraceae bacterium]|nr:Holliday junction resolvase RuvX [Paracoccaceae bacterium]
MVYNVIEEFIESIGVEGALMGLDLGEKTIGVAVSDTRQTVATGIKTIKRTKFQQDLTILTQVIVGRDIRGVILGLPKNMNGSEGPKCQSTRAFAKNISLTVPLPITFWDERLSTVAAERSLIEANASRRRRAEVIDYVAASFILQGVLDRVSSIKMKGLNS